MLEEIRAGSPDAESRLIERVYNELHRLAAVHLRAEKAGHSLQPTLVVNEVYLKLFAPGLPPCADKAHFFALASRVIRRILVDHARARNAAKRGDGKAPLDLDITRLVGVNRSADILAIDEALERLAALSQRQAAVVDLRFFGGLSVEQTAEALNCSDKTVKRDWKVARLFLADALKNG